MNQTHDVIIIGGGYAGVAAAMRLAGRSRGQSILLVNAAPHFVERIRLHQVASGQTLPQRDIAGFLRGTGIEFLQGWVTGFNPDARTVTVKTETSTTQLHYSKLVYALGSAADMASVPGVRDHAISVAAVSDAALLRQQLPELAAQNGRLLVVGGGLTGIEAASELAEAFPGLRVTLATRGVLGAGLSQKGRAHLRRVFARLGVTVIENAAVTRLESNAALLHDGRSLPFDRCLWAGAFVPPPLARESGVAVNSRGQILIDPYLRSISHPDVYGAGDAAQFVEDPGAPVRMSCAAGMPMGMQAGANIAAEMRGEAPKPHRFAYFGQCISLGRHDGLVQFVHPDDTPRERVLTGGAAARFKEFICKSTIYALHMERLLPGSYPWPRMEPKTQRRQVAPAK